MTILKPDEKDVKRDVKRMLDQHGWWHFMPPANVYGAGGIADILAVKNGHLLCIETKYGSGAKGGSVNAPKATPLQEKFLREATAAGATAMVINERTVDKLKDWLVTHDLTQD